jgi:hypothetical protein
MLNSLTMDKRPATNLKAAYVYAIVVDDIIRYIGKGYGSRLLTHAINARRTAARSGIRIDSLAPRMHRSLVKAIRAGSRIVETIIASGLSNKDAYRLEAEMIAYFHRYQTGQLWNTIDERFMDPRLLPPAWDDTENPLYRLPRPLTLKEPWAGFAMKRVANGKGQSSHTLALR